MKVVQLVDCYVPFFAPSRGFFSVYAILICFSFTSVWFTEVFVKIKTPFISNFTFFCFLSVYLFLSRDLLRNETSIHLSAGKKHGLQFHDCFVKILVFISETK